MCAVDGHVSALVSDFLCRRPENNECTCGHAQDQMSVCVLFCFNLRCTYKI